MSKILSGGGSSAPDSMLVVDPLLAYSQPSSTRSHTPYIDSWSLDVSAKYRSPVRLTVPKGETRLLMRSCLAVPLLVAVTASIMSAATGTMEFRVRDSHSHYAVRALIKGDGPQSFLLTTDAKGYGKIDLPVGEYRLEMSASGYAALRTHYHVEAGKLTSAGAFLDPQTLPEEESPKVLEPLLRPGYTLLHEYVVDAQTGEPLSGVKVRFVNAGVETQTDSKGHLVLSVPTPTPKNPGGIGTDTLIYEKAGYKTITIRNFGIPPEEMGGTAIDLQKGKGVIEIDGTHKLMRGESDESQNQENTQSAIPGTNLSPELYAWLGTKSLSGTMP